ASCVRSGFVGIGLGCGAPRRGGAGGGRREGESGGGEGGRAVAEVDSAGAEGVGGRGRHVPSTGRLPSRLPQEGVGGGFPPRGDGVGRFGLGGRGHGDRGGGGHNQRS